jgi:hypothetical protein
MLGTCATVAAEYNLDAEAKALPNAIANNFQATRTGIMFQPEPVLLNIKKLCV